MKKICLAALFLIACTACSKEKMSEEPHEMMLLTAIKEVKLGEMDTTFRLYTYNPDSTVAHFRYFTGRPGKDTIFKDYFPTYKNGKLWGVEQLHTGQPVKAPCYYFQYELGTLRYAQEHLMVHIPTAQTSELMQAFFEFGTAQGDMSSFIQRERAMPGNGWQTDILWEEGNISELQQYSLLHGVPTLRRRVLCTNGNGRNPMKLQREAFLWHLVMPKQLIEFDGFLSLNNNLYTRIDYFEPADKLVSTIEVQYFLNEKKFPDTAHLTVSQFDANGQLQLNERYKRLYIYENKRIQH